jgi:hypothetical protein
MTVNIWLAAIVAAMLMRVGIAKIVMDQSRWPFTELTGKISALTAATITLASFEAFFHAEMGMVGM